MRLVVGLAVPLLVSGCAFVPPQLALLGYAADGVSYAASGKSTTDHALSAALERDCRVLRVVQQERICRSEPDAGEVVALKVDDSGDDRIDGLTDPLLADPLEDPVRLPRDLADLAPYLGPVARVVEPDGWAHTSGFSADMFLVPSRPGGAYDAVIRDGLPSGSLASDPHINDPLARESVERDLREAESPAVTAGITEGGSQGESEPVSPPIAESRLAPPPLLRGQAGPVAAGSLSDSPAPAAPSATASVPVQESSPDPAYFVVFGSFASKDNAERLAARESLYISTFVPEARAGAGGAGQGAAPSIMYRVHTAPLTHEAARNLVGSRSLAGLPRPWIAPSCDAPRTACIAPSFQGDPRL